MRIFRDSDADLAALAGRAVAVIGYGNQGRAHALNLRDSGLNVIIGQRPGGSADRARADGFAPQSAAAAAQADLLILALPDDRMAGVYRDEIEPHLRAGQTLGFIHGFNIHFGRIAPPPTVDVVLVAPKGPGTLLRQAYAGGRGIAALVAVHSVPQPPPAAPAPVPQPPSAAPAPAPAPAPVPVPQPPSAALATQSPPALHPNQSPQPAPASTALARALAWAKGIGCLRVGALETTFAQETVTDLFGEQTVLCGGVVELMKHAFDVLVAGGYPPELAYFECVHELKQVMDLVYERGLDEMRRRISSTARYGGLMRGPQMTPPAVVDAMRAALRDIESGDFARRLIADAAAGAPHLKAMQDAERAHPMNQARAALEAALGPLAAPTESNKPGPNSVVAPASSR